MKLNEECDLLILPNGNELSYGAKEAIPFLYYNNKLYVGDFSSYKTHGSIIYKIGKDLYDDDKDISEILDDTDNNGRIWTEHKILSFWNYPVGNEFSKVIYDLQKKLKINIWDNGYLLEFTNDYFDQDLYNKYVDYPEVKGPYQGAFSRFIPIEIFAGKVKKQQKTSLQYRQLVHVSDSIVTKFDNFCKILENDNTL